MSKKEFCSRNKIVVKLTIVGNSNCLSPVCLGKIQIWLVIWKTYKTFSILSIYRYILEKKYFFWHLVQNTFVVL